MNNYVRQAYAAGLRGDGMNYPCLIPECYCKTPIKLELEQEGLNEYGEPFGVVTFEGMCNYQDKAKTILTFEKKLVEITGSALFPGDICPTLPVISCGTATIFGVKRQVQQGAKIRNPNGSVNYTEVLLI